ncbi:MAG: tellurium resistance protein TerA [Crocinitomicaceae bacterium]|nr:tellurium resistance protein TerA [Crocinitomicaceae bacterium]|tara:strand:- start:67624 stop:68760 length:1137 start_codon:yes stop_codon:yes gene_type:complete
MVTLSQGANAPLPTKDLDIVVHFGGKADVSSFRLFGNGKTRADSDFVFYNQTVNDDRTVELNDAEQQRKVFKLRLGQLKPDVEKLAFSMTVDKGTISNLQHVDLMVMDGANQLISAKVPMQDRIEKALILCEVYKRNGEWKIRFVSQGFNGGLEPLAKHYGVDVESEPETPNKEQTPVNLSKVTLTKSQKTVSLEKKSNHAHGKIKVNLNWDRKKSGVLNVFAGGSSVDLDLGAFVRLKNGEQFVIQALGRSFGKYKISPFVQLQGDDRTGDASQGEWLWINGGKWDQIDEVLIFSFIYKGTPNWKGLNAKTTVLVDGQPPVETSLDEGKSGLSCCAIARLINVDSNIHIERVEKYFRGIQFMDKAFNWGFRWRAGSK